jgi:hypothetical protein
VELPDRSNLAARLQKSPDEQAVPLSRCKDRSSRPAWAPLHSRARLARIEEGSISSGRRNAF